VGGGDPGSLPWGKYGSIDGQVVQEKKKSYPGYSPPLGQRLQLQPFLMLLLQALFLFMN
jgi:hypothetical protein